MRTQVNLQVIGILRREMKNKQTQTKIVKNDFKVFT